MVFSVVVLLLQYYSAAFVMYSDVFYRRIRKVENLFISLRVLSESSKTCYFQPVSTLLLSAMVSMSHIYCLQIARLY